MVMANISLAKNFVQVSCKFFFFVTLLNYLFYLAKCTIFLFDSLTEKPEWLSNPIKKKKKKKPITDIQKLKKKGT